LFSQLSFAGFNIKDKPEAFVQMGHIENIFLISFTPGGKYILSSDVVGQAKLWDPTTGREIRNIDGFIIAFSSNRKYALFAIGERSERKKLLRVWDLEKNKFVRSSKLVKPIKFEIAAISNDGKTVLLLKRKTFILWDLQKDKKIREFQGHEDNVISLAFSLDSKYALSGSEDKTMRLWDVKSGKELKKFEGHEADVSWVSFAPGGKIAASAGEYDETIRLWDIDSGKEIKKLKGESKVYWLNFSPDGKRILAGSETEISLWDVETGVELLEKYKKQARDKVRAELEAKARIEAEARAKEKAKEGIKFEIGSNGQKIIVEEEVIIDIPSEELSEFEEEH
jgi:WD40 repeat protein